jgi:hypothetical protein
MAGLVLPACGQAAHELAAGPAGAAGARDLVQALADRFGPVDREAGFDAIRPKLAAGAMVPSRVFDDPSAWRTHGDGWRAVDLDGYSSAGVYRIGARAQSLSVGAPGQYRGRIRLSRIDGGRFEWNVTEELALGRARPSDLARALDAVFRGAERAAEPSARAEIASALPRASAKIGLLLRMERLALSRGGDGATLVELGVRLTPSGLQGIAPHLATYLDKYVTPMRTSIAAAGADGVPWWTLTAADNLWTARLRLRDGSLVPLDGPAERRLPGALRVTADFGTRMGRFKVGAHGLVVQLALTRTATEKAVSARFLEEPQWELPFLVETILHSPLRYPFEPPGSEVSLALRETPAGTVFAGLYRSRVRENWILRWLGGMTSNAVEEFRRGAEREADQYNGECLRALRDDVAALVGAP